MIEEKKLFTSESVSEGHPDKVADQISDAILDAYIAKDADAHVACETLVTTNQVVLAGEVKSTAHVDVSKVVRETIKRIGYTEYGNNFDFESCSIINLLHEQSADIDRGVIRQPKDEQGAGDQGMMFGYATNETETFMPLSHYIATKIVKELALIRKYGRGMKYLRPDSKSQVTVEYKDSKPFGIDTIVVSTQHEDFIKPSKTMSQDEADAEMQKQIAYDVENYVLQEVKEQIADDNVVKMFDKGFKLLVNPTGKFVIGGPHGDTGLTGRKIIVDTYGGAGAHGGGAFSGKDSSKVDRSAAYMARYIAKNMVAAGVSDKMLIQISYAIGMAEPVSICVDTYGTSHVEMTDEGVAEWIASNFDMRPRAIVEKLKLNQPIYEETAAYGHMGRIPCKKRKKIEGHSIEVELFTWEKLDSVDYIKEAFGL
jgi:S-adenosylmethionine synthetase